jgi:ABC-type amino acid transport substrate-binding protein
LAGTAFCQPLPQRPTTRASLPDRELIVATKEAAPFAMKESDGSWQGIGIDLWHRVAEQLHLRNRFVEAATVEDLIAATSSSKVDAAVAAITVTAKPRGNQRFHATFLLWFGRCRRERFL